MMYLSGIVIFVTVLAGTNVNARYVDPAVLTLEDAKHYMDTNHAAEAQEFEVVSPWEVESKRKRRGADSPVDISEYKFNAFGEEFHLQLTTNQLLTRQGLKVEYVSGDGSVEERPLSTEQETCYKFGQVLSHKGRSRVAVSTCNNGVSGMVKLEGFELFIQKLSDNHTQSVQRKRRDLSNPHIVYRRSAESDDVTANSTNSASADHYCALDFDAYHYANTHMAMNQSMNETEHTEEHDDEDSEGARRRKKRAATCPNGTPVGARTLELMVVVDSSLNEFHRAVRDVQDYTLTLMNTVASNYQHESLGSPLTIKVVRLVVLNSDFTAYNGGTLSVSRDGGATLDSFCQYQHAINAPGDDDPLHYDSALLLSRYDLELNGNTNLLGIAQINGTCSGRFACGLVEENGFGSGLIATHELGHNLGMEHDGTGSGCEDGMNIMSSFRSNGPESFKWSTCSQEQYTSFLCSNSFFGGSCLNDDQGVSTFPIDETGMPGLTSMYNADEQCRLIRGDFVGVCTSHTNICGHLACRFANGRCAGTGVAAVDGTDCGSGQRCYKGTCVTSSETPDVLPPTGVVINGGWSNWTPFGQCSLTCGLGLWTRTRQCNNPVPQNGGQQCAGSSSDTQTCFVQACLTVVNGGWTQWQFGPCSRTCGGGQQTLTRTCTNPAPQNGGQNCFGNTNEIVTCNTQICPTVVHGGWSDWTYSGCSRTCGGGTQTRSRTCTNPTPQNGGQNCFGNTNEIVTCNTQICPTVVHGGWSDWTYSGCSRTCGGGTQTRSRTCTNPTPQNGGSQCSGSSFDNSISCNTQACPVVVHGGWTDWTYSSCSRTCGGGTQTRSRSCSNPFPQNGGSQCSGNTQEVGLTCNTQACPVVVHGGWTDWTYSACSTTCGGGTQTRSRTCTSPTPQNGGSQCSGNSFNSGLQCNTQACPVVVHGGWSDWTYSDCSRTCGGGTQTRSRSCTNPTPQNGGSHCYGSNYGNGLACNTQACPVVVHGGWSDWTYSDCSRTCGSGTQTRSRSCTNPTPQNGGSQCSGNSYESSLQCNTQACSVVVHGGWSDWTFSDCSTTCGAGTQTRSRTCTNPTPRNGGSQCSGSSSEGGILCNTHQPCPTVVDGGWSDWTYSDCSTTCGAGTQTRSRSCTNPSPQGGGSQCPGSNFENGVSCNLQSCSSGTAGAGTITERGTFNGGQYSEYVEFLTIPVGTTSVLVTNHNYLTHMAIKVDDSYVLGYIQELNLPSHGETQQNYLGMLIIYNYSNMLETITISGPTVVELKIAVHVILHPTVYGEEKALADIEWEYEIDSPTTSNTGSYQWIGTAGTCSVTCGLGETVDVLVCAEMVDDNRFNLVDDIHCSGLSQSTPNVYTCYQGDCPDLDEARWFVGNYDCEGLCGQASAPRSVFCVATTGDQKDQVVDEAQCEGDVKPSETVECENLPSCQSECNKVVTSEGAVSLNSPTGGELCGYSIVAEPGKVINLQIVNYKINCPGEGQSPYSSDEKLVIKDSYATEIFVCDLQRGETIISSSNVIQIEHSTLYPGHGYQVIYSFVDAETPASSCDAVFTSDYGVVQSPNYPSVYPSNTICHTDIIAPADMTIQLNINAFNLFPICSSRYPSRYDYLQIRYYGEGRQTWLCGQVYTPASAVSISSSNAVHLTFRSDRFASARGFHLSYNFVPKNTL
ncbi:A disintegrin and metalloproteinase with thrombospondin motifs 10-like [Asterias amurensis]|uniref:A disintegrin and metalloproteinase with thrombospondin motifs 10-like n=1 Tax=Asterias amurensis TaxID=7602 RepID=UPI003AB859BE